MTNAIWPAILLVAGLSPSGSQPPARDRPPSQLECPRDHLTSYTGVVSDYHRENGRTTLTIRTDWDTTERVELKHPRTDDPSRWFLLRGRPFTADDWKEIEVAPGRLKAKMRASAWVCDDGTNAIIDWDRPREK